MVAARSAADWPFFPRPLVTEVQKQRLVRTGFFGNCAIWLAIH